jgi:signal transduction histidine kinase
VATSDDVLRLSPFPVVDLKQIAIPRDGLLLKTPKMCVRNFHRATECRQHYSRLLETARQDEFVQCPYGLASLVFTGTGTPIAITGIIPHPRLGGSNERRLAKQYPDHHVATWSATRAANALCAAAQELRSLEADALRKHSVALHELRKLNRSVKQTAERLCREESPKDPEAADVNLVRIWKVADLMSNQFDVVELLANEGLAALPLNSIAEIYKLFDKCVRIYQPADDPRRIVLSAPAGYSPRVACCDKTLPIIPTVLVENALRYALKGTDVTVTVKPEGDSCLVEVGNLALPNALLTDRVFEQGVRVSPDSEGSGNGLYLAQLVARQHGARIRLKVEPIAKDRARCTFSLTFRTSR